MFIVIAVLFISGFMSMMFPEFWTSLLWNTGRFTRKKGDYTDKDVERAHKCGKIILLIVFLILVGYVFMGINNAHKDRVFGDRLEKVGIEYIQVEDFWNTIKIDGDDSIIEEIRGKSNYSKKHSRRDSMGRRSGNVKILFTDGVIWEGEYIDDQIFFNAKGRKQEHVVWAKEFLDGVLKGE